MVGVKTLPHSNPQIQELNANLQGLIWIRIRETAHPMSMSRILRRSAVCLATLVFAIGVVAQDNDTESTESVAPQTEDPSQLPSVTQRAPSTVLERDIEEEIIITEEKIEIMTPATTILDMYDANARGGYYYRLRKYDLAYPYLKEAAKSGFKESQARLGFIYQQGLGGVERNWIEAVGWLGVAASKTSRPEIMNYWKRLYKRIPEERHEMIDHIVEVYVEKYGSDATGVLCSMNRPAGSHIKKMRCYFEDEIDYRDPGAELFPGIEIDTSVGGGGGGPSF